MVQIPIAELKKKKTFVIENEAGRFVVVPWDEFSSLQETAYLLQSKANRDHLKASMKSLEQKKQSLQSFDIDSL